MSQTKFTIVLRWAGLPIRLVLASPFLLVGPVVCVVLLSIYHSNRVSDQWERKELWEAVTGLLRWIWGN